MEGDGSLIGELVYYENNIILWIQLIFTRIARLYVL